MARCSKAEEGRGEMERLRSPATRTSTGVGVPPRGVKPKNLSCSKSWWLENAGNLMEITGDWETLKGFERSGMVGGDISGHQELLDG